MEEETSQNTCTDCRHEGPENTCTECGGSTNPSDETDETGKDEKTKEN